jgi:mono/diheme cytochrome c family protein
MALLLTAAVTLTACGGEGKRVYAEAGCHECHGMDMRGTMTSGPSLRGAGRYWDVESLLVYFANPDSVAATDARLTALRARYGSGMPPLKVADPNARRALAEYVLR